jgi:hypothetical protein
MIELFSLLEKYSFINLPTQVTSLYNIFVQIRQGLFGQLLHIIKYGKW